MKNLLYILSIVVLIGGMLTSCSEEGFMTFDGSKSGIYFQRAAVTDIYGNPTQFSDSTVVSFASYNTDVQTSTVRVPVCTMGNVKDYDRTFVVKVDEKTTTAERGIHYDFDESNCVIPANETTVILPITLYRHNDLKTKTLRIELCLFDNNEFTVELEKYKNTFAWNSTGKEICGSRYKIIFNDSYAVTTWWDWYGNTYYGAWSASKEERLNAIMGWTHRDWEYLNVPYGQMAYAAKLLRNELQALADAGTPVIDDDGSYMQLVPPYEVDYSAYE